MLILIHKSYTSIHKHTHTHTHTHTHIYIYIYIYKVFITASLQTGLDTRSMTWGSIIVGIKGRGRSGTSQGSSLAGLCWSSAHLVQCAPDEPSWSWTQISVQACMPDYSLNWTVRSSTIQGGKRCQYCSSFTWRWLSRSQRPFGLESAIGFDIPSDTNARRPS